jgi:hypothetical protein
MRAMTVNLMYNKDKKKRRYMYEISNNLSPITLAYIPNEDEEENEGEEKEEEEEEEWEFEDSDEDESEPTEEALDARNVFCVIYGISNTIWSLCSSNLSSERTSIAKQVEYDKQVIQSRVSHGATDAWNNYFAYFNRSYSVRPGKLFDVYEILSQPYQYIYILRGIRITNNEISPTESRLLFFGKQLLCIHRVSIATPLRHQRSHRSCT